MSNINDFVIEDGKLLKYNGNDNNVVIPDDGSVTSLGDGCFSRCASLESISVAEGNPIYHSKDNCLIKTATGKMIAGCKNSIIPVDGSVTSLGDGCFGEYSSLKSISIPMSVTSLGDGCFNGCKSLESITIPKSITALGDECFSWCKSLKSIAIPESVTALGDECFFYCTSLKSIMIPKSVTSLGKDCFHGCVNLTIYAKEGSVAAKYAEENDFNLELI